MKDDQTVPLDMRLAAERCLATPSIFAAPIGDAMAALAELQRIASALGPMIPLATDLRAERQRGDMLLAQLQMHEAMLRGLVERLEAVMDAGACSCPPRGVYVVLRGGYCPDCMGQVP